MNLKPLLAAASLTIASTTSHAIALNYDIGSNSSVTSNDGFGLTVETALVGGLSSQAFTLNDGESYSFDFFRIWTDESRIDLDDWILQPISATLDFDVPNLDAQIHGVTVGGFINRTAGGAVIWFDPVVVNAGDRSFVVNLSNEVFDEGRRPNLGDEPATVSATIRQISWRLINNPPPSRVPDAGSTLGLLGLSVALLGFVRRKLS